METKFKRVLVTGGAGFIGQYVCREFLAMGAEVMSFDCLLPQVHPDAYAGSGGPHWPKAQVGVDRLSIWFGDASDPKAVIAAYLTFKPDLIIHLAAMVGVGQSAYMIATYVSKNVTGTAVVLDMALRYNAMPAENAAEQAKIEADMTRLQPMYDDSMAQVEALSKREPDEVIDPDTFEAVNVRNEGGDVDGVEVLTVKEAFAALQNERDQIGKMIGKYHLRLAELAAGPTEPIRSVIVAGSMSSYGEGSYACVKANADEFDVPEILRGNARIIVPTDHIDFECFVAPPGIDVFPVGITESADLQPASVYAWTKAAQEQLAFQVHRLRGLDVRIARFFNVYGEGQALANPYTGIVAIFAARVACGLRPIVYEDGGQIRDFIHASDVASAVAVIAQAGEAGEVYNVGLNERTTVLDVANTICDTIGLSASDNTDIRPEIPSPAIWRVGDVRHCFADSTKLRALGWVATIEPTEGIAAFARWVRDHAPRADIARVAGVAEDELIQHGLLRTGGVVS